MNYYTVLSVEAVEDAGDDIVRMTLWCQTDQAERIKVVIHQSREQAHRLRERLGDCILLINPDALDA
jgi:hypothetical protein